MYPAPVWLTGSLLVYDMPTLSGSQEVPTPRLPLRLDNPPPFPPKRPYINLGRTVERYQSKTPVTDSHRTVTVEFPSQVQQYPSPFRKHFAFC